MLGRGTQVGDRESLRPKGVKDRAPPTETDMGPTFRVSDPGWVSPPRPKPRDLHLSPPEPDSL